LIIFNHFIIQQFYILFIKILEILCHLWIFIPFDSLLD